MKTLPNTATKSFSEPRAPLLKPLRLFHGTAVQSASAAGQPVALGKALGICTAQK